MSIELDPLQQKELEHLFENFSEYSKDVRLNQIIEDPITLVAATIAVHKASSGELPHVLNCLAFGVYLAEIGKAHLMMPAPVIQ